MSAWREVVADEAGRNRQDQILNGLFVLGFAGLYPLGKTGLLEMFQQETDSRFFSRGLILNCLSVISVQLLIK